MSKLIALGYVAVVLFSLSVAALVRLAAESGVLISANEWSTVGGRFLIAVALVALSVVVLRAGRRRYLAAD